MVSVVRAVAAGALTVSLLATVPAAPASAQQRWELGGGREAVALGTGVGANQQIDQVRWAGEELVAQYRRGASQNFLMTWAPGASTGRLETRAFVAERDYVQRIEGAGVTWYLYRAWVTGDWVVTSVRGRTQKDVFRRPGDGSVTLHRDHAGRLTFTHTPAGSAATPGVAPQRVRYLVTADGALTEVGPGTFVDAWDGLVYGASTAADGGTDAVQWRVADQRTGSVTTLAVDLAPSLVMPVAWSALAVHREAGGATVISKVDRGAGTGEVTRLAALPSADVREIGLLEGRSFFTVGSDVWVSDGTVAGTKRLAALPNGQRVVAGSVPARAGGRHLVRLEAASGNLGDSWWWHFDAGTGALARVDHLPGSSVLVGGAEWESGGGRAWFVAGASRNELWSTDGRSSGTRRELDLGSGRRAVGAPALSPSGLVAVARRWDNWGVPDADVVLVRRDTSVWLPKVTATKRQKQPKGTVKLVVRGGAGEATRVRITGTVKVPGRAPIALTATRKRAAAGATASLTVRVPKARRAVVRKAVTRYRGTKKASTKEKRKVVATVRVELLDDTGNSVKRTVKVRLV